MVRYAPLAVAAALLTTVSIPSIAAPSLEDAGSPTVVTVNGSGCDHNDPLPAKLTVIGNEWNITYLGTSMVAQAGPGVPKGASSRKNCQLNLAVDMPKGYAYAVKRVHLAGTSSISAPHTARISLNTYFQGRSNSKKIDYDLPKGVSDMFYHEAAISDKDLDWSDCSVNRNLNINTSLSVDTKGNNTVNSMVRQDQGGSVRVGIVTKKC